MNVEGNEIGVPKNGAIARFQLDLLDLDQALSEMRKNEDWDLSEIAETYFRLNSYKAELAVVVRQMETYLLEKMSETEAVSVSSGDMIVKEWSKNRKSWQHKQLAEIVSERIERSAVDMDTGEVTMSTSEMIQALLEYVQPSYWRVGALSNIGVNADDYCQSGDSEPKIRIEKTK
jgi:hypothetical protein